jgi:5-methylcytosine-specific restriction endonuclease McrA
VRIKPATSSRAVTGEKSAKTTNDRRALSMRIRCEVFKRDSFTCQYCAAKAPDALLHVDHIVPVSKGGTNDLLNLVTACSNCNAGKTNRQLSDLSIVEKQRRQIEEIQDRKEQIELMLRWKKELLKLDDHVVDQLADYWAELVEPFSLTETGKHGSYVLPDGSVQTRSWRR